MLKNITRRTWSVLIALVMVWTTFCIGQPLTASAAVTSASASNLTGLKFVVPEAIYLKPLYNSYYQATQSTFQWYVNNTLEGAVSTGEESQGSLFFNYSGATNAKLGFEWLSATGGATAGGNITVGGTSLSVGSTKDISSSSSAVKITGGTSPSLAKDVTGAYIRWTVTYTDSTDLRTKTVQAYTYVYKPYVEPIGTAIETLNDRGDNHYGGNLSWICGVHDTSVAGDYYPNTGTSKGLMAISSSDTSGTAAGSLYAQIADRFQMTASNDNPSGWLNQDTSSVVPDKSFRYVKNDRDGYSSGDVAFHTFVYSGTGVITVDTSRYTNLEQIPNLTVGLMVTDDESTDSGASYFVANYTGSAATDDIQDYNKGWSTAQGVWDKYNEDTFWSDGGEPSSHSASESEGIKYNGKWPKAISGTGSATYYVGTGYFNRQGSDTIWNISELRTTVVRLNKGTLRTAVLNAISASPTLQAAFYNISSSAWENYVNLFKTASMALTKLDGTTFSYTVNGSTYTTPASLATALNGAVSTLTGGSGRVQNLKATQTNIVLRKVGDDSYVYAPFLNGTTTRTATFTTYDTVTFSADSVAGYSFIGLERTTSAPSQPTEGTSASYPTNFTTSDTGATFSGNTVKYIHADTTGCVSGNLYYTYYYIANTYSVHFDGNGATGGSMTDQTFTYNVAQNLSANGFERQGYAFDGWAKSASGSKVYGDSENVNNLTTTANGTVNLYAKWKTVDYTILYETSGGSITGDYVSSYKITDTFTLPGATKSGYSMTGWRADDSGNWSTMTYTAGNSVSNKYGNVKLTAVWKSNNYSVAFNPNGGTGASMANQSFVYGTEQALTANAYSRDGFTFRGWALTATASDPLYADKERVNNLTTEANAVVTLYAVWGTNSYTIVYSTDSGTIRDTSYTRSYTVNDQIGLPVNVEKTGYTFTGWKPAGAVGTWNPDTVYNETVNAGMIGNVTLQAQWTKLGYTISYEYDAANGGTIVGTRYTTDYDVTTTITLPSARKTGYAFGGWLSSGGGNWGVSTYNAGNISAGRYGDVTMTAQFTGNQYYVQFNGNGSTSGTMFNQSFTYGTPTALNANEYSRGGYSFTGWALSATATSAAYADQALVSNLSVTAGATVNLYAIWEKINYTIVYDTTGATTVTPGVTTFTITDPIRLPVVERNGYTLLGWVPAADNGSWHTYDTYTGATIPAGCYGNVTLQAQWTKDSYTITYDAQGGTLSGTYTTTYDVDTTIVLPTVTRTGYNFGGWRADAAWNNVLVTDSAPAGAKGNVKLTAQWTQKTYYIHYAANGGIGSMNDQLMRFDVSANLTRNDYTRDGYNFGGWAMTETGSAVYFDGDSVLNLTQSDGATVTLYAVWTARTFSIAYDLNGADGSLFKTNNVVMDGDAVTLRAYNVEEALINNKRYAFKGWSYTPEGAALGVVNYANRASFQMNEDVLSQAVVNWSASTPVVTLYAVWSELEIKLIIPDGATTVIDTDRKFIYGLAAGLTQDQLTTEYLGVVGNGELVVDGIGAPGTGTVVRLVNKDTGDTLETYEIVIFGDINGDGLINSTDYTNLRKITANVETVTFNTAKGFACDLFADGDINSSDLTYMRAISSGKYQYDQVARRYAS